MSALQLVAPTAAAAHLGPTPAGPPPPTTPTPTPAAPGFSDSAAATGTAAAATPAASSGGGGDAEPSGGTEVVAEWAAEAAATQVSLLSLEASAGANAIGGAAPAPAAKGKDCLLELVFKDLALLQVGRSWGFGFLASAQQSNGHLPCIDPRRPAPAFCIQCAGCLSPVTLGDGAVRLLLLHRRSRLHAPSACRSCSSSR
jgi:hypothetical protein